MKLKESKEAAFSYCVEKLKEVSQTPEAEARIIFEELDINRNSLKEELSQIQDKAMAKILDARLKSEPLQYILKSWQFRYLDLYVDSRVLIPRPETEITTQCALDCLASGSIKKPRVLDLGCGSGAIGLSILKETISEYESLELISIDVSQDALDVAQLNFQNNFRNNLNDSQITFPAEFPIESRAEFPIESRAEFKAEFKTGDWFSALNEPDLFHLIVSNPPYISVSEELPAEVKDYEPELALRSGVTGFEDLEHIISTAKEWLFPDGYLVVELAPDQAAQALKLASLKYQNAKIQLDMAGRQRVLIAQK